MDLTVKLSNHTPECEMTFPVTLSFSGRVKDQASVRKSIFDALVSWIEDGPGFVTEDDDCYTIGIAVKANEDDVFATIRWRDDDLVVALERAGVESTPENIKRFKESRTSRTLKERSVEEGWIILDTLITNIFF